MLLIHKFYKADSTLRKPKEIPQDFNRATKSPRNSGVSWFENFILTMAFHSKGVRVADPMIDADLLAMHQEVCAKAGIKPPKLLVANTKIPNAVFLPNGSIAVTSELVKTLEPEETKAVMAHEVGHRIHRWRHVALPVAISLISTLIALPLVKISANYWRPGRFATPIENRVLRWFANLPIHLGDIGTAMVGASLSTAPLRLSISRTNELQSDDEAVRLTGQPEVVASALEKIHRRALELKREMLLEKVDQVQRDQKEYEESIAAVHQQADAKTPQEMLNRGGNKMPAKAEENMHATHPSTQNRVRRLLAMRERQASEPAPSSLSR